MSGKLLVFEYGICDVLYLINVGPSAELYQDHEKQVIQGENGSTDILDCGF